MKLREILAISVLAISPIISGCGEGYISPRPMHKHYKEDWEPNPVRPNNTPRYRTNPAPPIIPHRVWINPPRYENPPRDRPRYDSPSFPLPKNNYDLRKDEHQRRKHQENKKFH